MKNAFAGLFCCLIAVSFLAGCKANSQSKLTTVATVNGSAVSSTDYDANFEKMINALKTQNPQVLAQPYAQDIIGKRLLQDMIIKEIFLQEAKKENITATTEETDAIVAKVKEQFAKNSEGKDLSPKEQEKAFKDALKQQNLTKEKYLSEIANDIIIEKFRRSLISSNLKPVTKEETKQFYDNVSAIYNNNSKKIEELKKVPGRFEEANIVAGQLKVSLAPKAQIDTILVFANKNMQPEQFTQRKTLAQNIKKEITDNANFQEIALKYSENKDNKVYFSKMNVYKDMQPNEISSKALSLNVGNVSGIIEVFRDNAAPNVAQGFFIINVKEKAAGQKFTYASFEKQLENYINTKRAESIISQTVANLLKQADIKILKEFDIDKTVKSSETVKTK